jgi:LacI family transcriptional regulator
MAGSPAESVYSLDGGQRICTELLSGSDRPTAIICGNDVLAAGAMRGARQLGLRIPEDISIVGFDNIDLAAALNPPLTTVNTPHRQMGRAAAKMLLSMPDIDAPEARLCFPTRVVDRGSLAQVAADD